MIKLLFLCTFLLSSGVEGHVELVNETHGSASAGISLVNYIIPDCSTCSRAAELVKSVRYEIYRSEVDCSKYSCDIAKFPMIIMFINSRQIEYTGELNLESLSAFVDEQISLHWFDAYLTSEKDLEEFINSSDEPKVVTNVPMFSMRSYVPSLQYGYSNSSLLPNNTVRVYKGEHYTEFDNTGHVVDFLLQNTIDTWNFVGTSSMKRAFTYSHKHVLLFDTSNTTRIMLDTVAEEFSPEYVFVFVSPNDFELVDFFQAYTYPSLILVTLDLNKNVTNRYPLHGTIDADTVKEHIQQHEQNNLKRVIMSERERPRKESSAYRVTGASITELVYNYNIFLMTSPGDELMDRLYLKFKNTNLMIATYDIEKNKNDMVSNEHLFQLFLRDSQTSIHYDGDTDEDTIIRFLDEYGFSVRSEL